MTNQEMQQKANFNRLVEFAKKGTLPAIIVDSSDLAIKAKTLDGTITSWNHGAEKIYGYGESEIIGKNISMLIPPNQSTEMIDLLKQVGKGSSCSITKPSASEKTAWSSPCRFPFRR